MRKYVGMVLALICIVTLTACGSDKKITLPELEKITEIEIIKNTSERGKKVTGKEEISKIISELKDNFTQFFIDDVATDFEPGRNIKASLTYQF